MLTEAEKRWLEERSHDSIRECRKCGYMGEQGCLFVPPLYREWCCLEHENQDWIDCAEFEARVAARLAEGPEDCQECFWGLKGWSADNAEARLKRARLAVEEEMEECTK